MNNFYFSCDWVVDYDGINKLEEFLRATEALKCELWYSPKKSDDGYTVYNLTVQASSESVVEEFIKLATNQLRLAEWILNPKPQLLYKFPTAGSLEPRSMSIWLERILSIASDNQALRKMLDSHEPSYYATDWIVPTSLENTWLDKFIRAYGNSAKTGAEFRMGERGQMKQGLYTQRIMVRLLTTSEFEKFLYEIKRISGPTEWFLISKDDFLKGVLVSGNSESIEMAKQKLLLDVYNMSQSNSREDAGGTQT